MTGHGRSAIEICRRQGTNDGDLRVVVDGEVLVTLNGYPIAKLAGALEAWLDRVVDDEHAKSFVFQDEERPGLTGTFRIEPRPADWQFTSMREKTRHSRMLPLTEYREIVQDFINDVADS